MTSFRRVLCLCVLMTAGCPTPPPPPDGGGCTFALEWGKLDAGSFAPFADADPAEITVGFQGFRFIESVVEISGVAAATTLFNFQIAVEGHPAYVQAASTSTLVRQPSGALRADVLVFFNDIPMAELIGRNAQIRATASAAGCRGTDGATVVLVDQTDCVQQPDGGILCTDGGVPEGGVPDGGLLDGDPDAPSPDAGD